jgi:hypothetical protein
MARLPMIAAAVLAIAASAPVICTTTSPASAQGWRDRDGDMDRDLRDLLRDRIRTRQDLRDLIIDLLQDRQDLRGRLRERISHLRERDEDEDGGGLRGRLRERIAERIAERRRGGEEGDCGTRTGICSSSFAGACVATEHGPKRACPDLIGLCAGVRETSCSCK